MNLSDRSKTSIILCLVLLAAAVLFIPWGRSTAPGPEYPVSDLDLSAMTLAEGVSLTVDDITGDAAVTARLVNGSPMAWGYGADLFQSATLDIGRDGVWYRVPLARDAAFIEIYYHTLPGGLGGVDYSQSVFDPPLVAGEYRLVLRLEPEEGMAPGAYYTVAYFRILAQ